MAVYLPIVIISLQLSCAQTAEEFAGEAAEEVVEEAAPPLATQTLDELDKPENRQRIGRLISLPALADAGELFGRGLSRGTFAVWGEELSPAQIESMAQTYLGAFSEVLEQQMLPIIAQATRSAVEAGMAGAFNARSRQQAEQFARALTGVIVDTTVDMLIERLGEDLGPAIRRVVRDEVGAGLAEAMRQHVGPATVDVLRDVQFRQALAETAQVVGRNSVLGANQGMVEVTQGEAVGGGPIEGLGQVISQGRETLQTLLWMLGVAVLVLLLFVVVLGLGLWRAFARSRELMEENKLREDALVGMARAVQAAEEKDADILDSVLRDIEHRDGAGRVRELLRHAGRDPGPEPSPPSE